MRTECIDDLMIAQFERICHASESNLSKSERNHSSTSKESVKLEFERGTVSIVAATSGDDKTKRFCNVLIHRQRQGCGQSIAISNEPLGDLGMRLIELSTMIDGSTLRSGHLTDSQWPRLTESVQRLRDSKARLVCSEGLTASSLQEICSALADKHGSIGRVLIDSTCLCTELQLGLTQCAASRALLKPFTDIALQLECAVVIFHWDKHQLAMWNRGKTSKQ